ncbi:MAG TPA: type I glyceraldehyde-3-phosphate dehydrogenase [Gammaproteobacteria bacterium]|nr:type I glyceraldehyde-3-phosphate dehydrogenase [Gammaproteobacteria bacterium]
MKTRIAINGFGRIGRGIVRALFSKPNTRFELVAINDLYPIETLAHLLKYDSVHGRAPFEVNIEGDLLVVNGHKVEVTAIRELNSLPWAQHEVDVVFECTGLFASKPKAKGHLQAGAKKVIISAPAKEVDATIVYGVNHHVLTAEHSIISNASCTTNCLAPVVAPIHRKFGIESGLMTTVHAYTNDQSLTDAAHSDLRRARAAALSMIPTKTGAAAAIGLVIPELKGKLDGLAIRVPTANVSMVDVTLQLCHDATVESVNEVLIKASKGEYAGVLAINTDPLVSIDFNQHPASSIADLHQTRLIGRTLKVMSWYDNEWGFSNRMLDTAHALMMAQYSEVNRAP